MVGINIPVTNGVGNSFACEPFVLPDGVVDRQARRLHETRARRPETAVRAALAAVRAAAAEGRNAVPAVVEAVGTGATLGEAGTAFRQAFGTWTIPIR